MKNVGLFPKNVGDFLNYLRRFFVFCALFLSSILCCFFSFYVLLLLVLCVVFFLFMRSFLLMHVVDASPFVVDCSSLGWYFVNNILVFRGGGG